MRLNSIANTIGVVVISIIGMEMLSWTIIYARRSTINIPQFTDDSKDVWCKEFNDEMNDKIRTRWEPYFYWRCNDIDGKYINVKDGVRRTWRGPAAQGRKTRIQFYGGSLMWGLRVRDDYTIPSMISKMISTDGGCAEITNFGEIGYVSTQELFWLAQELKKGNVPDIVVFMDGINDTISAVQSGRAGIPGNEYNRINEFNLTMRDGDNIKHLLRKTGIFKGFSFLDRTIFGEPKSTMAPGLDIEIVREYERNVMFIKTLSRIYGFKPYFYWQPVVHNKKNRTDYEERIMKGVGDFIDVHLQTTARLKKRGLPVIVCDNLFDGHTETVFSDFCHLNEHGDEILAQRIYRDIVWR